MAKYDRLMPLLRLFSKYDPEEAAIRQRSSSARYQRRRELDDLTHPWRTLEEWQKWLRDSVSVSYERKKMYKDYIEMDDKSIEVSGALSTYADDATAIDWKKKVNIDIESSDYTIKKELVGLINKLDVYDILWAVGRNLAKYGDNFERLIFARNPDGTPIIGEGTRGIIQIRFADPKYIERVEDRYSRLMGFHDADPWYVKSVKEAVKKKELDKKVAEAKSLSRRAPWDFAHFRMLGSRRNSMYGDSMIENARPIWKILDLLTEVIAITRLSRAPSRRIYYIDVGEGTPNEEAWDTVRFWRQKLKKNTWINPITGEYRSIHDPRSPSEDLFWPLFGQRSTSRVEELPGLVDVKEMADINLMFIRLFSALRIPPAYFGFMFEGGAYGTTPNNARTLTLQDLRYARTIKRLQNSIVRGFHRIFDVHLALLGVDKSRFRGKYKVLLTPVSTDEEMQRAEIMASNLTQASQWGDIVDRFGANKEAMLRHVLKEVLGFSSAETRKFTKAPPPGKEGAPGGLAPGDINPYAMMMQQQAGQQPGQTPGEQQPQGAQQPPGEKETPEDYSLELANMVERITENPELAEAVLNTLNRNVDVDESIYMDDDPLPGNDTEYPDDEDDSL